MKQKTSSHSTRFYVGVELVVGGSVTVTTLVYIKCLNDLEQFKNHTQLAQDCNCRLPCDETVLTATATSGQTGITGDLENLQFNADYNRLLENMRQNRTEIFLGPSDTFGPSVYGASRPNFKYLEELIQVYSFRYGLEYNDARGNEHLLVVGIISILVGLYRDSTDFE